MFSKLARSLYQNQIRSYHRPHSKKAVWRERISVAYMVIATTAFGVVVYACAKGKTSWVDYYGLRTEEEKNMPSGMQWAHTLGIKNATVIQFSGFKKVGEYSLSDKEDTSEPKTTQ